MASIRSCSLRLFTETEPWRPKGDGLSLPSLPNLVLEMLFDEEEVTRALYDSCGDKARGLDGMSMAFLEANGDTV